MTFLENMQVLAPSSFCIHFLNVILVPLKVLPPFRLGGLFLLLPRVLCGVNLTGLCLGLEFSFFSFCLEFRSFCLELSASSPSESSCLSLILGYFPTILDFSCFLCGLSLMFSEKRKPVTDICPEIRGILLS